MKSGWLLERIFAAGGVFALFAGVACNGPIRGLEKETATPASVQKAAAANDWQYVDNVCHDRIQNVDGANTIACKTYRDDQLKKALAAIHAADCEKLPEVWDAQIAKKIGDTESKQIEDETIPILAKCPNWDAIFERITDAEVLDGFVKDKLPVELNLMRFFSKQHPFPDPEAGAEHATVLLNWLVQRPTDYCDVVVSALSRAEPELRMAAVPYFVKKRCVSASGGMNEMLWNGSPRIRKQSCDALAVIGGVQSLQKVSELAEKDTNYEMDGAARVYYVRDACAAAARKIRERNPEPEQPAENAEDPKKKDDKKTGKKGK